MAPKLYVFYGSPVVGSVLITAEVLGISLDIHELNYEKGEHVTLEFLKINPQHTAPTLVDDNFAIWDSHAINAYLVGKYGKDDAIYPKDLRKRALVDQRLNFDSESLFPLARNIDLGYFNKEIKEVPAKMIEEIKNSYDFLEKFLEGHQWVAGNTVTIADFNMVSTVTCLDCHVKIDPKTYPNIINWIKRATALPCFVSHTKTMKYFKGFLDILRNNWV